MQSRLQRPVALRPAEALSFPTMNVLASAESVHPRKQEPLQALAAFTEEPSLRSSTNVEGPNMEGLTQQPPGHLDQLPGLLGAAAQSLDTAHEPAPGLPPSGTFQAEASPSLDVPEEAMPAVETALLKQHQHLAPDSLDAHAFSLSDNAGTAHAAPRDLHDTDRLSLSLSAMLAAPNTDHASDAAMEDDLVRMEPLEGLSGGRLPDLPQSSWLNEPHAPQSLAAFTEDAFVPEQPASSAHWQGTRPQPDPTISAQAPPNSMTIKRGVQTYRWEAQLRNHSRPGTQRRAARQTVRSQTRTSRMMTAMGLP